MGSFEVAKAKLDRTRKLAHKVSVTGSWHFRASVFVLCACLALGGGTRPGFLSDAILQLICIPLLCWTLWIWRARDLPRGAGIGLLLCAATVLVPVLQLIPLPDRIVAAFPVRAQETAVFEVIGQMRQALPITVSRDATILAALSLLPPVAVYLSVLLLSAPHRRAVVIALTAFGVLSAFIGLVQISQGPESALRFFDVTNIRDAVGFFANRNHFAAFLNCTIVFVIAWTADVAASAQHGGNYRAHRALFLGAGLTAIVVLLAGAVMARSRAGLGLTAVAVVAGFFLTTRVQRRTSVLTPARLIAGVVLTALVIASQYGFYRVAERFTDDPLKDSRATFARVTFQAIKAYFPLGSGLGTFTRVYPQFEKPQQALPDIYVNRAHDDVLEYVLETGILGLAVMGLAALVVIRAGWTAWTRTDAAAAGIDATLSRAASISLLLIGLHSVFDYPLRTSAMAAVMALCFALLWQSRDSEAVPSPSAKSARGATPDETSLQKPHAAVPTSPVPTPDRKPWGEGIEWPEEWRTRPDAKKTEP